MIQRGNNRLHITFGFWFLAVALVPSVFVAFASYVLQKDQAINASRIELENIARVKEYQLQSYLNEQVQVLTAIRTSYEAKLAGGIDRNEAFQSVLEDPRGLDSLFYFIDVGGNVTSTQQGPVRVDSFWKPQTMGSSVSNFATDEFIYIASYIIERPGWFVIGIQEERIAEILHTAINDAKFFSQIYEREPTFGVGKTADIFIIDASGRRITNSLMSQDSHDSEIGNDAIRSWIQSGSLPWVSAETSINGRPVVMHGRMFDFEGSRFALVATIDQKEIVAGLYSGQRNLLVFYLLALSIVFIVLYFFVGTLSRVLIAPLYGTIVDLAKSAERLKKSIATTEKIVKDQDRAAIGLREGYSAQLKDVKMLDTALGSIVSTLSAIGKHTKLTAQSVSLIDTRASHSQREASEARQGINHIKQLAIAHSTLAESLSTYSDEVNEIAKDVRKLSDAITYLSLNAGIESGRGGDRPKSVASLVSEVGKLSRLSNEASRRIKDLVHSIQGQLTQTKVSAESERIKADASITTINKAVARLSKVAEDTKKITSSVSAIDEQVQKQLEGTYKIVVQSNDLSRRAENSMRETAKLTKLSAAQKISVRSNVSVARRLVSNINRLRDLIGTAKNKDHGKT